jgi:hypothetical protein
LGAGPEIAQAQPALIKFAQLYLRQINEARDGDYAKKAKNKAKRRRVEPAKLGGDVAGAARKERS